MHTFLGFENESLVGAALKNTQTSNNFRFRTCICRSNIEIEEFVSFMFQETYQPDSPAGLFVNDYNIEDGCNPESALEM